MALRKVTCIGGPWNKTAINFTTSYDRFYYGNGVDRPQEYRICNVENVWFAVHESLTLTEAIELIGDTYANFTTDDTTVYITRNMYSSGECANKKGDGAQD